jgi:hypothetical protein
MTSKDLFIDRQTVSRRQLLRASACGFGSLALAGIAGRHLEAETARSQDPLAPKSPVLRPRAKRVIFLYMEGGPSQIDMFDYKPALETHAGTAVELPQEGLLRKGKLFPSPWRFTRCSTTGLYFSELLPHLSKLSSELCLLQGMTTDSPAHPEATLMLHTGAMNVVRPSMGSWLVYGLGTENRDLPAFVTVNPIEHLGGAQNYSASFLPACFQGSRLSIQGEWLPHLRNERVGPARQRRFLDLVQAGNREYLDRVDGEADIESLIHSHELAFRMQTALPEVLDISKEPAAVRERYGVTDPGQKHFGAQCLMARRMAEAGVRFIQLTQRGWDNHTYIERDLPQRCADIDRPIATLISDLKRRGMLDDTLIVWGGEFGRTPADQNPGESRGRHHNNLGYTMFLAGGGVRGGMHHGETDAVGSAAVDGQMHIHDLHATILHILGLDHEKLTYRHAGRDFRLTEVAGRVVGEILE